VNRLDADEPSFVGRSGTERALAERAETIETRWGLPARKWLRMLNSLPADPPD